MFEYEEYLRILSSLVVISILLSCCAVWFAYKGYKISLKTYKHQRQINKLYRKRAKRRESEIKNHFYEANNLALKTKKKGENIVRNINKHLLKRTPEHSGLMRISQASIMSQENKDALYTLREEIVHAVVGNDRLIENMSVDHFSDELMEEIKNYADTVDDKCDEVTEIFEENEMVFSKFTEFSSGDLDQKIQSTF